MPPHLGEDRGVGPATELVELCLADRLVLAVDQQRVDHRLSAEGLADLGGDLWGELIEQIGGVDKVERAHARDPADRLSGIHGYRAGPDRVGLARAGRLRVPPGGRIGHFRPIKPHLREVAVEASDRCARIRSTSGGCVASSPNRLRTRPALRRRTCGWPPRRGDRGSASPPPARRSSSVPRRCRRDCA